MAFSSDVPDEPSSKTMFFNQTYLLRQTIYIKKMGNLRNFQIEKLFTCLLKTIKVAFLWSQFNGFCGTFAKYKIVKRVRFEILSSLSISQTILLLRKRGRHCITSLCNLMNFSQTTLLKLLIQILV